MKNYVSLTNICKKLAQRPFFKQIGQQTTYKRIPNKNFLSNKQLLDDNLSLIRQYEQMLNWFSRRIE